MHYLDGLIGELEPDVITTIYGPGGSGKTLSCMLLAAKYAKKGKVIYIDTEGGFSIERFNQVVEEEILDNIIFLKPTTFTQQKECFQKLKEHLSQNISLIVVDTIALLYRLELGRNEDVFETNRALGRQISLLTDIARTRKIPIFITNQVYSQLGQDGQTRMVGGDMLMYTSKCLIELEKGEQGQRKAILRKHRSKEENKNVSFKIVQSGLECNYS